MAIEHVVGRVDDLPIGGMKQVEVAETKILLVHLEDGFHALLGSCPHAGGDLVEGVLVDGHVVCPWHKARFCVRSGEMRDPPAVDNLPTFPVRIADAEIVVSLPETAAPPLPPKAAAATAADSRCFAILGAGAAGAVAAQTLREAGFLGRVVLIGREDRLPYDRTVLSKYVLAGTEADEKSPLQNAEFYQARHIERRVGDVASLDIAERRIVFADGAVLPYDEALVATGGVPRPAPMPGGDLGNVFLLRTAQDAERIVAMADPGKRAVVVGAGFIAMEAAASLCERGLDVTVIAPQSAPFEKQLGPIVGGVFARLHQKHGVRLLFGRKVVEFVGNGVLREVRLEDGDRIAADLAVVGLGVTPATEMLRGIVLREDGGVSVNAELRAAPGLHAAGDVAAFPLFGDGPIVRVEHWRVAEQQGRTAAFGMLGRPAAYDAVPYFWTIQFGERLDYVGHAEGWDDVVIDGDIAKPEFIAYYVKDEHVAAAAGFARDRDMAALITLLKRRRWTPNELCGRSPAALL